MVHFKPGCSNLVGDTIDNGTLLLLEVLGSGAYGVVYRAVDVASQDGVQYAVKCLSKLNPREHTFDFHASERALHSQVSGHPNIVTLHRSFEDAEHLFMVFDFCPGGDLFGFITTRNTYWRNDELVKLVFTQLIDAVDHCHRRGVFHRDLKPENILCSKDGTHLQLADFGLATGRFVVDEFRCGSSYYMSPECLRRDLRLKEYATAPSDVWALGIILINMITNRNPWRYAVTQDACFSAFLEDVLYLREMLPISKEANKLFRRIFTLTPHCRITLSQLRVAVQEMDTFFMTDRELQRASVVVQDNAILYAGQGRGQDLLFASEASSEKSDPNSPCSTCSSCSSSFGSDEILALVYSDFHGPVNRPPRDTPAQRAPLLKSSDDTSSADSAGPITPETHPTHPVAEVPPLSDDEGLCEAVLLPVGSPLLADPVPKAEDLDVESLEKLEV